MSKRSYVVVMMLGFVFVQGGCASTSPNDTGDIEMTDQTRTKVEGTALGAALGALLGSAVAGGSKSKSAMIGGVIGAGAGFLAGNEVAKRKLQYASEEDFLDGEIISAQSLNRTASAYNSKLGRTIDRLDQSTQSLRNEYEAGSIAYSELEQARKSIQGRILASATVLDDLEKEQAIKVAVLEEQKRKRGPDDEFLARLEVEVKLLQENIDELNLHSQQLASIDDRLER